MQLATKGFLAKTAPYQIRHTHILYREKECMPRPGHTMGKNRKFANFLMGFILGMKAAHLK
jgi:hypothetical protein